MVQWDSVEQLAQYQLRQREDLPKLGVVLKRAQFFITCGGRMRTGLHFSASTLSRQLEAMERGQLPAEECQQLSLFDAG